MEKTRIHFCVSCGPVDDELYQEYVMAGELIEYQHGDSDTGHRLQAELDGRYEVVKIQCRQCAYLEAHGSDHYDS
tara:strand:+ start:5678 stop:5902 length:225 start_codon:yes stop_codon:yes gene_type:complete